MTALSRPAAGAAFPRPAPGWRGRLVTLLVLAGAAFGVVWTELPLCPTASLFGVPCPGCGLTRASLALLSGDLHAALHLHPLVPVLLPAIAVALGWSAWTYLFGIRRTTPSPARERLLGAGAALLLVLMLGVWGLRFAGYFGGPVPVERVLLRLTR